MKFQFEGSTEEFLAAFGQILIDPGIEPDRDNLIVEAIHMLEHARQVHVNRGNFIAQLQCLIKAWENEQKSRVEYQERVYMVSNWIDRQIGNVTTIDKFDDRFKDAVACITNTPTRTHLHRGVGIEVLQFSHHKDESQKPSEGDGNPASLSENAEDHF